MYEFEDSRSETALISFARGGYKKQDVRVVQMVSSSSLVVVVVIWLVLSTDPHHFSHYFSLYDVFTLAHPMDFLANGSHGDAARDDDLRRNEHYGIFRDVTDKVRHSSLGDRSSYLHAGHRWRIDFHCAVDNTVDAARKGGLMMGVETHDVLLMAMDPRFYSI